ncbi:hypothetical protein F4811DRAFT_536730 [Daldinia bambusicola]|nr:hypothetical protein F4811DRAFT_536730 [Daldinia bambusicola]
MARRYSVCWLVYLFVQLEQYEKLARRDQSSLTPTARLGDGICHTWSGNRTQASYQSSLSTNDMLDPSRLIKSIDDDYFLGIYQHESSLRGSCKL